MSDQTTLPGTEAVIGSYECGHGRTHQVPSGEVTVLKTGGVGFTAGCCCGSGPITTEGSTLIGDHLTVIGGNGLEPALWLALERESEEWFPGTDPDLDPLSGNPSSRERRESHRKRQQAALETDVDESEDGKKDGNDPVQA